MFQYVGQYKGVARCSEWEGLGVAALRKNALVRLNKSVWMASAVYSSLLSFLGAGFLAAKPSDFCH